MASTGRIFRGVGFGADAGAICAANAMAERAGFAGVVAFHHVGVGDDWPSGSFDAVTMIDVMHHMPRTARPGVMDNIAATLSKGGTFVYKDTDLPRSGAALVIGSATLSLPAIGLRMSRSTTSLPPPLPAIFHSSTPMPGPDTGTAIILRSSAQREAAQHSMTTRAREFV